MRGRGDGIGLRGNGRRQAEERSRGGGGGHAPGAEWMAIWRSQALQHQLDDLLGGEEVGEVAEEAAPA